MVKYIESSVIIDEWLEDLEMDQQKVNYPKLRRWYTDAVRPLQGKDSLGHKIALLHLDLGTAELPSNLESLVEVAYRLPRETCTTREQITGWTQKVWGEDCELEINLKCDNCKKARCNCNEPVIDIVIDQAFLRSNPWYAGEATRYGTPYKFSENTSVYDPNFKLLKYANNSFHRLQWHIPNCQNLQCTDCSYSYVVDFPHIKTDLAKKDTELLVTYRAYKTDEKGTLLCPDNSNAIESVKAYLTWKRISGIAGRTLQDQMEAKAGRARANWERLLGIARAELEQLPFDQLWQVLEDNLTRVPNRKRSKSGTSKYQNHLRY